MKTYPGASWHKQSGKWQATIRVDKRTVYLGGYETRKAASIAHQAVARYIAKPTIKR